MSLDLNGLNGSDALIDDTDHAAVSRPQSIRFFPILVFDDLLRGPEPGSIALVPQDSSGFRAFPPAARRLPSSSLWWKSFLPTQRSIWLCATAKLDSPFSNIEGHQYDYDRQGTISYESPADNLHVSQEFANALGRPVGRRRNGRQNLRRRSDAAGRDPNNRQRRSPISDHATNARRSPVQKRRCSRRARM